MKEDKPSMTDGKDWGLTLSRDYLNHVWTGNSGHSNF